MTVHRLPPPTAHLRRRRLAIVLGVAAVVALTIFFPGSSTLLTDWWWFKEIGYQVVFTRTLITKALLFLAGGGLGFGVLYLNLRIAQRGVANPILLQLAESAPRLNVTVALRRLSIPISLGVGFLSALAATAIWDTVLKAIYGVPFGIADPVFARDVGFYVFTLPVLSIGLGFLLTLTVLSLLLVIPVYVVRGDLIPSERRLRIEPSAGIHVAILLAVYFVLLALELWLVDIPSLLYSTTGPLIGASYTDLHARLPAMRVSAVAALIAAVVIVTGAARGRLGQYAVSAIVAYAIVGVVGR